MLEFVDAVVGLFESFRTNQGKNCVLGTGAMKIGNVQSLDAKFLSPLCPALFDVGVRIHQHSVVIKQQCFDFNNHLVFGLWALSRCGLGL